ncbi:MAG TPA: 50S ribosomal protein L18 [Phycisphaerales bacterium]|nr:50S ribosomal protein L18 [Phycisphaerales bacterium]
MRWERIQKARERRDWRSRRKVFGTAERPRLTVFRSSRHIYAQVIDDVAGVTLAAASTRGRTLRDQVARGGNKQAAEMVGTALAKEALGVGIKCVCFDRNGYRYHGRVRALAEAARKAGLVF